jgi:hypothetical protein
VKGLLVAAAVVVLAVVVVGLALSVVSYNGLVRRRDQVDSAWSQVRAPSFCRDVGFIRG